MSRRRTLLLALLCSLLGVAPACDGELPEPRSIILISLDTLRADHLGTYGYERPTSPNIDALAASGIVFERAISQASSTLPAHRALFQSVPASEASPQNTALAEVLGSHGLRTAAFTGGANISRAFGFDRGFSSYVDDPRGFGETFDAVEIWLRQNGQEPFFLFLHSYDIHLPYDPPPPFDTMFGEDYTGEIEGGRTREVLRRTRRLTEEGWTDRAALTEADKERIVSLYDGGIRYTDQFIGRLTLLLRELSLADDTVVVLFSDHGEEFWEHDSVLHSHTLYDELIHVPLIVALPGSELAGTRVATTVRLMDIGPMLLDLLGIEDP